MIYYADAASMVESTLQDARRRSEPDEKAADAAIAQTWAIMALAAAVHELAEAHEER